MIEHELKDSVGAIMEGSMAIADRVKQFFRFFSKASPMMQYSHLSQNNDIDIEDALKHQARIPVYQDIKDDSEDCPKDIAAMFPHLPLVAHKILTLAETWIPSSNLQGLSFHSFSACNTHSNKFSNFNHVALASVTQQVLTLPSDIQLIANAFWKHAFYAANLAEKIAKAINEKKIVNQAQESKISESAEGSEASKVSKASVELEPDILDQMDPELCYLLGFTHNFGFLLFGYLFRHEFRLLNKWMHQYPNEQIEKLEKRLLGMGNAMHIIGGGHAQLGSWLMEYWHMPESFILVAGLHHERNYQGPYANYVGLIQLTNYLLKTIGIGEGAVLSEKTLSTLDISLETAKALLNGLILETEDLYLEEMAREFTN